ncbi:MAG: hypothetical protein AAGA56_21880 [Myxococcota bacterium]
MAKTTQPTMTPPMVGRKVFIQGATRGIGRAIVERLAAKDDVDTIFASGRSAQGGEENSGG